MRMPKAPSEYSIDEVGDCLHISLIVISEAKNWMHPFL